MTIYLLNIITKTTLLWEIKSTYIVYKMHISTVEQGLAELATLPSP